MRAALVVFSESRHTGFPEPLVPEVQCHSLGECLDLAGAREAAQMLIAKWDIKKKAYGVQLWVYEKTRIVDEPVAAPRWRRECIVKVSGRA